MWKVHVAAYAEAFREHLRLHGCIEMLAAEQLIAQPTIERLNPGDLPPWSRQSVSV